MAEFIRMPKMSDTMEHGIISRWIKRVGDKVVAGDILAEVETDKATMELEAFEDGTLLYIGVAEQSAAQINDIIAIIGSPEEDITALLPATPADNLTWPAKDVGPLSIQPVLVANQSGDADSNMPSTLSLDRVFASPLAKKMAQEKGYDITQIQGSGQSGRVVKKDVTHFMPVTLDPLMIDGILPPPSYEDLPISAMRQTIAHVLTESKMHIPHFYLTVSINVTKMVALRTELNQQTIAKISINDFILKATSLALIQHPKINSAWLDNKIRSYREVHIGVAVVVEDGLVVPVVRSVDRKRLPDISTAFKRLHEEAKRKKLSSKDYTGATFTVSNLGMFGIESFTAIINPPAACILAVGAIQQLPIVQDNQIISAHMLQLTLSCDHRVVDGAVGALFLATLKKLLEEPLCLLL